MLYVYRFLWPLRLGWLLVCCLYKKVYLQIFKRVSFWLHGCCGECFCHRTESDLLLFVSTVKISTFTTSATGVACQQGTLTSPDTWSRPFGTCICSTCWDQSFSELVVILPDYALRISLGTFSILLCIKAVHLSEKVTLICPQLWPIEDICIGIYVLKRLLNVRHILEKVMSIQHSFEEFSEKQRKVELKSIGNFVADNVGWKCKSVFIWRAV